MVRCPNGHENPEQQQCCGECGGSLGAPHSGPPASLGLRQQHGSGGAVRRLVLRRPSPPRLPPRRFPDLRVASDSVVPHPR
jgi:hypothetical protein